MPGVHWSKESGGGVPAYSVVAGNDLDGKQIFVGRAFHSGHVVPGKIVPSHGVCYVSWNGCEFPKKDYEALVSRAGCQLVWIEASRGKVPVNAIEAGLQSNGEILYIGRASYSGADVVGKVVPQLGAFYFPFDGTENALKKYEVLCIEGQSKKWFRRGSKEKPSECTYQTSVLDRSHEKLFEQKHPEKLGKTSTTESVGTYATQVDQQFSVTQHTGPSVGIKDVSNLVTSAPNTPTFEPGTAAQLKRNLSTNTNSIFSSSSISSTAFPSAAPLYNYGSSATSTSALNFKPLMSKTFATPKLSDKTSEKTAKVTPTRAKELSFYLKPEKDTEDDDQEAISSMPTITSTQPIQLDKKLQSKNQFLNSLLNNRPEVERINETLQKLNFEPECKTQVQKPHEFSVKQKVEPNKSKFNLIENAKSYFKSNSLMPVETDKSKEINILILGETGVGKSTFINGIANYLTYETLEEAEQNEVISLIPIKFNITDENYETHIVMCGEDDNEVVENGESATQTCKCYVFPFGEYSIRIIDTPGIGDVRGIEQDKKNMENLMSFLGQYTELHAICILMKPNNARMTVEFQFCLKQLLCQLSKSASQNIVFVFTNARSTFYSPGESLPLLKRMLANIAKSPPHVEIPLNKNTIFCMDNEAFRFLVAIRNNINFTADQKRDFSASWRHSFEESMRLITRVIGDGQEQQGLSPHKIKETLSVNDARQAIVNLSQPLADITKTGRREDGKTTITDKLSINLRIVSLRIVSSIG